LVVFAGFYEAGRYPSAIAWARGDPASHPWGTASAEVGGSPPALAWATPPPPDYRGVLSRPFPEDGRQRTDGAV